MIPWWNKTPLWQQFVIIGLVMVLFVLGMHTWVWRSLDRSIVMLTDEIAGLTEKNQEAIQRIASLKNVEREVALLRDKYPLNLQQSSREFEPQTFRREVVNIGQQSGVVLRLWKPSKKIMDSEPPDSSLDIFVKVEGNFYGTTQFIDKLLQLSWVKTVNPLVLVRKQHGGNASMVTTEFTIKGLDSHRWQLPKEMLKT